MWKYSLKYKNVCLNEEQILVIPFPFLSMYYILPFYKFKYLDTLIRYNIDDGKFVLIYSDLLNPIYSFFKYVKKNKKE